MSKSLAGSMADAWVQSPQGGELCRRILERFRQIDEGEEIMEIRVRKTDPSATLPTYATDGAAGMDLSACASGVLMPGARWRVPTGIAVEIPTGYEGQVRPRSGLSARGIVAILGTIDSDYRGEIAVIMEHRGGEPLVITPGMRIAQLVISPVARVELEVVEELSETLRGEGGFGSTGVSSSELRAAAEEGVAIGRDLARRTRRMEGGCGCSLHVGPPAGTAIRGAEVPDMGPEVVELIPPMDPGGER